MSNETDLKALQALVVSLNDLFQSTVFEQMEKKKEKEVNFLPFIITAGQTYGDPVIKFMGVYIWGGEDDNRKWVEETNDYEDLHDYLITQACIILKQLNTGMIPLMIQTNDITPENL